MKKEFQDIVDHAVIAKERLKEAIRNLPDSHDGVQMLSPNCGIVSLSTIAKHKGNLSAGYWLSHETKRMLLKIIDSNRSMETTIDTIEGILSTGKIRYQTYSETLAPNILKHLKTVWEG
jgi:hypothetical protein